MFLSTSPIKCIWFRSIQSNFKFWWPSLLLTGAWCILANGGPLGPYIRLPNFHFTVLSLTVCSTSGTWFLFFWHGASWACPLRMYQSNSPEKWLLNWITPAIGPNKSKKLTQLVALAHNKRGKVWMKKNIYGFTDDCPVRYILCAGAVSHASFLDLFGLIAGVTNPIM